MSSTDAPQIRGGGRRPDPLMQPTNAKSLIDAGATMIACS